MKKVFALVFILFFNTPELGLCDWEESPVHQNAYYLEMIAWPVSMPDYFVECTGDLTIDNGYEVLETNTKCEIWIKTLPKSDVENIEYVTVTVNGHKANDFWPPNTGVFGLKRQDFCSGSPYWEDGDEYPIDESPAIYGADLLADRGCFKIDLA